MPRSGDAKGQEFCRMPLSSSPFPLPNTFVPRQAFPRRFVSPPGPLDASPLYRPPPVEGGFRYRSPICSPSVPLSPYASRGPYCNSPYGVFGPNGSFQTPSSGSSYSDHKGAGSFRRGGYKSWNGTPSNGQELGRGVKRSMPSFHQVNR